MIVARPELSPCWKLWTEASIICCRVILVHSNRYPHRTASCRMNSRCVRPLPSRKGWMGVDFAKVITRALRELHRAKRGQTAFGSQLSRHFFRGGFHKSRPFGVLCFQYKQ